MLPEEELTPGAEGGILYSFAEEYQGPPVKFDLPRAVPIDVERIPVAAVVKQVSFPDKLALPVVQPLLAVAGHDSSKFSKELKKLASDATVSPTSVISFDRSTEVSLDCGSKELDLGSGTTVSPVSVIGFEGRVSEHHRDCALSGEFSSSGALDYTDARYGSGELSDVANSSRTLGLASSLGHEHSQELIGGARSSSTIEFSDSFDKSRESSSTLGVSNRGKESLDFNDLNQPDWGSSGSVLSLDYPSSRVSSRTVDCNNEPSCDTRRPPIVTFRDIQSDDDDVDEEFSQDEPEVMRPKREPLTKGKKGSCYRCLKGSWFTEKEICIVCDAKYCSNCVLRAMGSMPEGRKCVTCIGFSIDESKRGSLGKCSRMLKRLLNDLEVQQIMKAEKLCEANQLPPEYVCVNGKPLCHEELVVLQSCPNPPKKLKPGNYWYDRVSGLWGKEGQKPSKIISPHLNVGDPIKADASNGNTQVFINGREITKVELRMLQLAGVQCAGNPHFWVNEDGSYQEEGQKNTKGYIWGKAGTNLVCAFLSLPVPSKSSSQCGVEVSNLVSRSVPDYFEQRTLHKLLLVGHDGSGTSTIFKQAKILYKDTPFSEDERENIKLTIQSNVYGYLGILLEGRELFEDESLAEVRKKQISDTTSSTAGDSDDKDEKSIYSISPRLKAFSDWLLKIMVSGSLEVIFPAATREYAPLVEELWNDAAIRTTYDRRSELEMLPSVAYYFLERAVDILKPDYEPSDLDILYAEGVTSSNGLACVDFEFPHSTPDTDDQLDSFLRYQLIRVHSRGFGENCKWVEMLEDVGIVMFCVSLNDYDQFSVDGTNNMVLSRKLFESIVTHPTFEQTDFLLILNKFDSFEEKIERIPLSECEWFDDFHPLISRYSSNSNRRSNSINHNSSLAQLAFQHVAVKFKRLYSALTGRKLYVSAVKGLEPDSVDEALKYAREILKWEEERLDFSLSDYSMYSTEASSFSH